MILKGLGMNKSQLIEQLALREGLTPKAAEKIINTFFNLIADALANGDRVEIRGLGSFKVNEYEGYIGRNPKTGETVQVGPKKLPVFKVGKDLKNRVNS